MKLPTQSINLCCSLVEQYYHFKLLHKLHHPFLSCLVFLLVNNAHQIIRNGNKERDVLNLWLCFCVCYVILNKKNTPHTKQETIPPQYTTHNNHQSWWIVKVLAVRIESFIIKLDYPTANEFSFLFCWRFTNLIVPVKLVYDGDFYHCWSSQDCQEYVVGAVNPTKTVDMKGLIPQDRAVTTSPLAGPCLWTPLNRESIDFGPLRLQLFKY